MNDLVGFRRTHPAAERALHGAVNYWRLGPVRPGCSIVVVSYRDWELHRRRRECRSPDCPNAVQATADPKRLAR
jgi:hypothetical protein